MNKPLIILAIIVFSQSVSANKIDNTKLNNNWYDYVLGKTPKSGLFLGMWSWHYTSPRPFEDYNWNNKMLGFNYKSFFIGTYDNSYNNQNYLIGIRRDVYSYEENNFNVSFGYMMALVYGYKEGAGPGISKYSPVLPIPQVYMDVTYYHVGFEATIIPGVATIGFKVLF